MTIDLLLVGAIVVGLAGCPMMMWLSRRRGNDAMACCLPRSRSSVATIDDEASRTG